MNVLTFKHQAPPEVYFHNIRLNLRPGERKILQSLVRGRVYVPPRDSPARGSAHVQIANIRRELLRLQVPLKIMTIQGYGYELKRVPCYA